MTGTDDEIEALAAEGETAGVSMADLIERMEKLLQPLPGEAPAAAKEEDIRTILSKARLPEKIKYAMFGNAVCRALLVFDPNRMIQQFVLRNPKLTQKEVEEFARNPNCPEGVLRAIADKKEWMKWYPLKLTLVSNPKTPQDVSLKWLKFLNPGDLKTISRSKNLPQTVMVMAKKKLADLEKRK